MRTDDPDRPPFGTVAIVGVGLIGGSLALVFRRMWPAVHLLGIDRAPVLALARTRNED